MELPRGRVLRQLCRQGNVDMVRKMLEAGVPVDAPQEDGCTGLWLAAEAGCADVVKLLAESAGANVNAVKTAGNISALYIAAQNGHISVVDVLLVNGANPNIAKTTGATPLFIASQQNYIEIVTSLLKAGSNPNAPTSQGVCPLMIAAFQGNGDVARKLLSGGADPNLVGQGRTALDWAKSNNHGLEYQRILDDHLRDMEAEVRRRQQMIARSGAGVLKQQPATPSGKQQQQQQQQFDTSSTIGASTEISSEAGGLGGGGGGGHASAKKTSASGGSNYNGGSVAGMSLAQRKKTIEETEAAELPFAIADAAATLHSMGMSSSYLIPSASMTRNNTSLSVARGGAMTPPPGGRGAAGAVKTSSFYTKPLGKAVGRMDRSLGQYGGMSQATIAEEERRAAEFRKMVKKDGSGSSRKVTIPQLASPSGTILRQELYNVEQQWESHRDRVAQLIYNGGENDSTLSRNLALSREANTAYALRALELGPAMNAVRQNAADQREQSAQTHANSPQKTSGWNFPRLPSKKLNALHSFMAEGRAAKGPPVFDDKDNHHHNNNSGNKSGAPVDPSKRVSFL